MNQLKTISWNPKFISLLVAVTEPSFQQQLGASANLVTGPSQWETSVKYSPSAAQSAGIPYFGPTEEQFSTYYAKIPNAGSPTYHSGEAGASIIVLAYAIEKANSLDTAAPGSRSGTTSRGSSGRADSTWWPPISNNLVLSYTAEHVLGLPRSY